MRVLVVDDDRSFSEMLAEHLERVWPTLCDAPVDVATAFALDDAIEIIVSDNPPGLVILDLNLEGDSYGHATFKRLQDKNTKKVPVAILTGMSFNSADAVEIIRACYFGHPRAQGFLLKRGSLKETVTGLGRVLNGERFIPDEVVDFISQPRTPNGHVDSKASALIFTERQRSVVDLIMKGLRNKEIAAVIGRSELYVRQINREIFQKVDAHTRTQFMVALLKRGAVNQSDYA